MDRRDKQQPRTTPQADEPRPWSPAGIALIAFFFAPGGAILTVRNLQRLGTLSRARGRELIIALAVVFTLGYALLAASSAGGSKVNPDPSLIINIPVAIACLFIQWTPFRTWQARRGGRPSPWIQGLGLALLYDVGILIAAVPVTPLLRAGLVAMGL